ncbi:MAG: M14 family metallopeptidase, partial [Gemmatimonadota bacterium]
MHLRRGRHTIGRRSGRAAVLAGFFVFGATAGAEAQRVPIDFDAYHGYGGTVAYLEAVAEEYPRITRLLEIGRSEMGRPIQVLVVSNMETGTTIDAHVALRNMRSEGVDNVPAMERYHGKPGVWIDGGTHGNEYTGTEVSLYIVDRLVSGYGTDPEITRLVDENAFYICPMVNPDGVHRSVEEGIGQRQNSMERDDDEDGRVNEDGPDDLNGDGLITWFRYRDPEGRWVRDPDDPRLMTRPGRDEETELERWSLVLEDLDNDGDGEIGEDGVRGIDINRNYPEGWFRDDGFAGGSGPYAGSSPEARAILEFFSNNRNILLVQSFHTSGGFTYRPFARWSDERIHPRDLAVYDRVMAPMYRELHGPMGEPAPDADGPAPERADGAAAGGGDVGAADELWRHPYNEERDRAYGYGIFLDWAFAQYGAYAMSTELWDWRRDTRGLPGYTPGQDRAAWSRALIEHGEALTGETVFVPWEAYDHPQHGPGEVGGFVMKYAGGNALPGESLRRVADIHWRFERAKAELLPRLEITDARARTLSTASDGTRVVEVTATVTNHGALATQLAEGAELPGNREDAIWLLGDRDRIRYLQGRVWQRLGVLDGAME